MKLRYFLEISFNGGAYHGWQMQKDAITVQQVLSEYIGIQLGEPVKCEGCGRTDAGVHARKYLLHFDSEHQLTADFTGKLNSFLPADIRVNKIYRNLKKIHARWDALSRTYEYVISKGKDPFRQGLATVSYESFDIGLMNEACRLLMKYEDFTTFSKTKGSQKSALCKIIYAQWTEDSQSYVFRITANRFLRGMVRLLVGTLLQVGSGKISPEEFEAIIGARDRKLSGKSVAACGLYFTDVKFPDGFLKELKSGLSKSAKKSDESQDTL